MILKQNYANIMDINSKDKLRSKLVKISSIFNKYKDIKQPDMKYISDL